MRTRTWERSGSELSTLFFFVAAALCAGAGCSRRSTHPLALAAPANAADDSSRRAGPPSPSPSTSPSTSSTLEVWDVEHVRAELRRRRGHPLVVHMWASWCGPCLQELPAIDAFARRARERGIAVLSLALDTDYRGGGRVASVLRERAPQLTPIIAQFTDAGPFMAMFSRDWEGTIPALFVFDRAGTLQKSLLDAIEPAALDQLIEQLAGPAKSPRPAIQ